VHQGDPDQVPILWTSSLDTPLDDVATLATKKLANDKSIDHVVRERARSCPHPTADVDFRDDLSNGSDLLADMRRSP
jgi:hypothetical protein